MTDVWVVSRSDGKPDVECGSEFAAGVLRRAIEARAGSAVKAVVWVREAMIEGAA